MARIQELTLQRGNRGLLVIALGAGLVAAVLFFIALANGDNSGGSGAGVTPGGTVKVVVAKGTIGANTEITNEMVHVVEVPEAVYVTGALGETTDVVGEVTRVALGPNEQITKAKIGTLSDNSVGGLELVIPNGKRGIAIAVEEKTAVGGQLVPGNRIDILAAFTANNPLIGLFAGLENGEEAPEVVYTVLQNVEVLAVATEAQEPLPAAQEDENGDGVRDISTSGQVDDPEQHPDARTITVAVDPADAQLLVAVQEEATRVWTTLRPAGDEAPVDLPRVDISKLTAE